MAAGTAYASTKFWSLHEPTGVIYAAIASTLWMSIFWGLYRGPVAFVQASSTMFCVNGIAFMLFRNQVAGGQDWVNLDLYQRMASDGVIISTIFLGVSLFLARPVAKPTTADPKH
jgi:hypothetical protein